MNSVFCGDHLDGTTFDTELKTVPTFDDPGSRIVTYRATQEFDREGRRKFVVASVEAFPFGASRSAS